MIIPFIQITALSKLATSDRDEEINGFPQAPLTKQMTW